MANGKVYAVCDEETLVIVEGPGGYRHAIMMSVVPLQYDAILGKTWLDFHNPHIDWPNNTITFQHQGNEIIWNARMPDRLHGISVSAVDFARLVRKQKLPITVALVKLATCQQQSDDKRDLTDEERIAKQCQDDDIKKLLVEFKDLFPPKLEKLPPRRKYDHAIEVQPGSAPPAKQPYRMSPAELDELKKQLDRLLEMGYIRPSASPYAAPVLFARKKDGSLRMC